MSEPETITMDWTPQTVPGTLDTGSTTPVDLRQWTDKGFDLIRDVGAAFVGNLEGSVAGQNWTTISSLAASAQGAIAAQYNWVRVTIGTGGTLGATTILKVAGKIL
jgi:hypothetical protein